MFCLCGVCFRVNGKVFACDLCGRSYNQYASLYRHRRYECGKQPMFVCPFCPQRCKQKANINAHIRLKHADQKQNTA
ncbi:longitudinals lacking protein, isoforms A/B/D/L-like [Homalodisca vitripennis]|uniref:longitudinals lacking protein, isoforms A/B/D/L-like n=1 Tax=Homalodisca vitripennis TaxID=197043 RepID=UPI001EEA7553|nr:longitudinals lacking protein, isoforms A/B/D/L-like [Homalodisca vitripennis]